MSSFYAMLMKLCIFLEWGQQRLRYLSFNWSVDDFVGFFGVRGRHAAVAPLSGSHSLARTAACGGEGDGGGGGGASAGYDEGARDCGEGI